MAELVQLHVENTVPELEQMERIGLFERNEIKKIIKTRKSLEYTIRRRKKTKEDFLKFIQYEMNLLSLISKRRQRMRCDLKKQEIDHAVALRINRLFKVVTMRFQDDVKLWLSQIEFCKRMKWHHTISALFARMLQIHNSNPALWIMAAKWEMEENNAPENARQLLQRALRHHPESQHLWLEYFRMELMYTEMVKIRRDLLGLKKDNSSGEDNDAVLDGSIASVVYKNATSKIEGVMFALSFLSICQQFDFTSKHISEIFDDVSNRYPNAEETLDAVAKRPLLTLKEALKQAEEAGKKKKAVISEIENQINSNYEEAVEKVPTEKMWNFYVDFCHSRLHQAKKPNKQAKLQEELLNLMQRAATQDCLSCDNYVLWTRLLCSKGDKPTALSTSLFAARKWPKNVSLWQICLKLHIEAKAKNDLICSLFNEALESVKNNESFPIWQLGMQWMSLANPSKLDDFFERGVRACKNVSSPMKEAFLEVTALQHGVEAAREVYKKLMQVLPLSTSLYKKMIQIEKSQLKPSIEWLRHYYEDAVRLCGSYSVDMWLSFIDLEAKHPSGDPSVCDILYWRAMKALDANFIDEFVSRATLKNAGHDITM